MFVWESTAVKEEIVDATVVLGTLDPIFRFSGDLQGFHWFTSCELFPFLVLLFLIQNYLLYTYKLILSVFHKFVDRKKKRRVNQEDFDLKEEIQQKEKGQRVGRLGSSAIEGYNCSAKSGGKRAMRRFMSGSLISHPEQNRPLICREGQDQLAPGLDSV